MRRSFVAEAGRREGAGAGDPWAEPVDLGVSIDAGAPLPHLLADGLRAVLVFHAGLDPDPSWDGTTVTVVDPADVAVRRLSWIIFEGVAHVSLGYPSDEALHGHPLYAAGFRCQRLGVGCDPNGSGASDRAVLALRSGSVGRRDLSGADCVGRRGTHPATEDAQVDRPRRRRTLRRDPPGPGDIVPDPIEVEATTRDVDDDYLVALAREHGADYIVTGNKDMLEWPNQRPPVLTPAAFLEMVGE